MLNWEANLLELQAKIGYTFKDLVILKRALTAVSYFNENRSTCTEHQEAYSTLGSAVQDVIVMKQAVLCRRTKKGYVTDSKKIFAEEDAQAEIAFGINLRKYLRLGGSEVFSIAPKIFSRCFESLIGAIFIDGGIEAVTNSFWKMYHTIHSKPEEGIYDSKYSMFNTYNSLFGLDDEPFIEY